MCMFEVKHVSKSYGPVPSLHAVSFVLHPGSITGIIGPNGAGKSTLLKIMSGFEIPDAGQVIFNGMPLSSFTMIKQHVAFMPEQLEIYPDYTAGSFLDFLHRATGKEDSDLLQQLGLLEVRHKQIKHLSKGYRQRVKLYFALCNNRQIVLLDEPFDGFDPIQLRDIFKIIQSEQNKGRTFVVSIHQLQDAERICTDFLLMKEGSLIAEGSMSSLTEKYGLTAPSLEDVFMEALQ